MRLDRIRDAPLSHDPFDFLIAEETVDPDELAALVRDFPEIPAGGSFDIASLPCGPSLTRLLDQMRAPEFRAIFEEKFDVALADRPLHITVRGKVRGKDGSIHTDSRDKILTGLLYLNPDWTEPGGRLRLLRSGGDIEDYAREVAPVRGNMIVFRRSDRSFHGHLPSEGRRLSLQFNWVTGEAYRRRERARHRLSSLIKRFR